MVIGSQGDFSRDVQVRIAKSLVVNYEFEDTKFIWGLLKVKKTIKIRINLKFISLTLKVT
jgi:hypothetical protein